MRGFKQLVTPKTTDGAVLSVGIKHALPKRLLVKALANLPRHVSTPDFHPGDVLRWRRSDELALIDRHGEGLGGSVVTYDVHRPTTPCTYPARSGGSTRAES